MGGHQSTLNTNVTTNIVGSAVQNVTQDCINYVNAQNQVYVLGSGNVISDVSQTLSVQIKPTCTSAVTQDASFQDKLQSSVSQLLKDSNIALTQWMDGSKSDVETNLNQNISTNVTANTVQTCLNNINSRNILGVQGDANVVQNVVQDATVNLISQCLLTQGQTSEMVNDITNTVNQHSETATENPLAPLFDAWTAMSQSMMMVAGVVLVVIICFVFIFMGMGGGGGGGSTPIEISIPGMGKKGGAD